jgi:hypothetical protein
MPKTNRKSKARAGSLERVVRARRKVSVVRYSGYHAVYPGQAMLEKHNGDKSKNTVTWADIIPDQTHKTGNWKITVEYEAP